MISQEHPFVIPAVLWTRKAESWRKKPLTPDRSWCRKITWPAPTRPLQQLGTSNLRILPWKHKLSCPDWTAPPAIKPMKPPSGLHSCRYRKNTKGRKGPWITWLERSSAAAAAFGAKIGREWCGERVGRYV